MQSASRKSSTPSGAATAKGAAATVSGPTRAVEHARATPTNGKANGASSSRNARSSGATGASAQAGDSGREQTPAARLALRVARIIAVVASLGMFLVLGMGTLVTNTGSQFGCGNDWPLCKGQFIPEFTLATAIEFSHRAVVGVETLLVLAMAVAILYYWQRRLGLRLYSEQATLYPTLRAILSRLGLRLTAEQSRLSPALKVVLSPLAELRALGRAYRRMRLELRILLPLMIVFLLAQAALGALAVVYPESPEILALHFGVSLLSFVTLLLPTLFIFDENAWDKLRDRQAPAGFRWLTWGMLAFTYVVVYLGAYVRHTGNELGCLDWPLCNGKVLPTTHAETIVFIHRVGAGLLTIGVVWLFVWATRLRAARPDLYWGSLLALVFVLAQAFDGAFVVYSRLDIFSTLSHSAFVALQFGALSYLSLHVVRRPKAVRGKTTGATKRIAAGQGRRGARALAGGA